MKTRWSDDGLRSATVEKATLRQYKLICRVWGETEYVLVEDEEKRKTILELVAEYEMYGRFRDVKEAERKFLSGDEMPRELFQTYLCK